MAGDKPKAKRATRARERTKRRGDTKAVTKNAHRRRSGDKRTAARKKDSLTVRQADRVRAAKRYPKTTDKVNGRHVRNGYFANKEVPLETFGVKGHRGEKMRFNRRGRPDFSPWTYKDSKGRPAKARIDMTGSNSRDFTRANRKCKLDKTPKGYTWHHLSNVRKDRRGHTRGTLRLVRSDVHRKVGHTGGEARYLELNKKGYQRTRPKKRKA